MTQIDKLLDSSISQHGFMLVNNKNVIIKDLKEALKKDGFMLVKAKLEATSSPLCKRLYRKIKVAKK